jgi:hypothetical protein
MPVNVQYEEAASAFREGYPIGSTVRGSDIITWAKEHGNGLSNDLKVVGLSKQLNSLRRHLNAGGASRSFAEEERFVLAVEDAKREIFLVQSLAEYVHQKAEESFGKSVRGAMSPLRSAKSSIGDIKLEELPEDKRKALELQLQEIVETAEPLRKVLSDQCIKKFVHKLEAKGYSNKQARDLIEIMPQMQKLQKLLNITSSS